MYKTSRNLASCKGYENYPGYSIYDDGTIIYYGSGNLSQRVRRWCTDDDYSDSVSLKILHGRETTSFLTRNLVLDVFHGPRPHTDYQAAFRNQRTNNFAIDNLYWKNTRTEFQMTNTEKVKGEYISSLGGIYAKCHQYIAYPDGTIARLNRKGDLEIVNQYFHTKKKKYMVSLRQEGSTLPKTVAVHSIILEMFVEPRPNSSFVAGYKDGDFYNVQAGNLYWKPKNSFERAITKNLVKPPHHKHGPTSVVSMSVCSDLIYSEICLADMATKFHTFS